MRSLACVALLVCLGALGACAGRGLSIGGDGVRDFSVITIGNNPDFANDGCTQVGAWPNDPSNLSAFFTPNLNGENIDDSYLQGFDPTANAEGNFNLFSVEVDVPQGMPPQYPQTVSFNSMSSFTTPATFGPGGQSEVTVFMYANCDITQNCNNSDLELYLAQGGTTQLTRVDDTADGTMTASTSNLHLVQWPTDPNAPDQPLANGKCWDIGSFSASIAYTPNGPNDFGVPIDFATPVDLATHD
jgi:hypothetical protein